MNKQFSALITVLLSFLCLLPLSACRRTQNVMNHSAGGASSGNIRNPSAASSLLSSDLPASSSSLLSSVISSSSSPGKTAQNSSPARTADTGGNSGKKTVPKPAPAPAPAKPSWPSGGEVPSPVYLPDLDGQNVRSNGRAAVDLSYASYGIVKARLLSPSDKKIMVIVEHGGSQYYYSLSSSGGTEAYPLQMGNGAYTVSICENITGDEYSVLFSVTENVSLKSSGIVFRVPSQMVNYSSGSAAASIARRLVSGKTNNYERISAVLTYVAENIKYDYALAKTVKSGYIPDVDSVLARKRGICFDYASVSAAMLRSLGYPCRMIFGYVSNGKIYHAWNEVYLNGTGWIKVMSVTVSTCDWSRVDVTFISNANSSSDIEKYIGNASNYAKQYTY